MKAAAPALPCKSVSESSRLQSGTSEADDGSKKRLLAWQGAQTAVTVTSNSHLSISKILRHSRFLTSWS
jgi:hypothetical protein